MVLHSGISAVVIVVDNDGYTVERAIHGPAQPYNDIARWDWTNAPALFGADRDCAAVQVTTTGELDQALAAASASKLTLIQAVVPPMDVPELLKMLATAASKANAQHVS
jgi:alpha-keto-acid decarboxylase